METNEPFCHFLKHKGKSALADFPLCYTMKYSWAFTQLFASFVSKYLHHWQNPQK